MTYVRQMGESRGSLASGRRRRSRVRINKGRALFALAVLIGAIACFTGLVFASDEQTAPVMYKEVTVKPGDTLWKLARQHQDAAGMGVRELVDVLKEVNDLEDSLLIPGQTVRIPLQHR